MATLNPKVGQTVETKDGRQGVVRYVGYLHIAEGEWLGLELPDPSGKNDGSVKGERYFECQPNFGIFVRKESVVKVLRQMPAPSAPPPARPNGVVATQPPSTGTRPRPSSGITPDVARKRQSLMSAGSNTTAANRMSIRSPTKSPSKAVSSTASTANTSATSTPRTGTPATTARTSDSSTKSRMSISSRTSVAPQNSISRNGNHASRVSLPGGPQKAARSTPISNKPPLSTKRASVTAKPPSSPNQIRSSTNGNPQAVEEKHLPAEDSHSAGDNKDVVETEDTIGKENMHTVDRSDDAASAPATVEPFQRGMQQKSTPQSDTAKSIESRTAHVRELEQLKAKIRTFEKQRDEDLEKLQQHETMQHENERFRNIIQALQNKLKSHQQEMGDLRVKYEEAQQKNESPPERSAEQESEMELATLDKEMAEERAETFQMELEALRLKHEELELEVEILREENQELTSVMSPEEKASAGWMQMERERERLREALIMLRDMAQQTESDLKAEIRDLQENLDDFEKTNAKYNDTVERLSRAEQTNRHLMEQLEAVESNDEIVEAMEAQREQNLNTIEQLKKHLQELEEHIQVTDELENFHVEEEKRLHYQLDEVEALLNESQRHNINQDHVIEDLEYTLTKFRDVVQGLQSDIDELRRSREISEIEANEMSSKSRAMMDLNLRLQNNTAKSQSRIIDAELDKIQNQLGAKHIEVLNMFTLDSFDSERRSVLALICFGRLRAKSALVSKLLKERLRDRTHLSQGEELFRTFELAEQMQWITGLSERFENFMTTCTLQEFSACAVALYELEPVERTINVWLDALRHDEMGVEGPEHLKRMQGVLTDLADKLMGASSEQRATQLIVQMRTVENISESLAGQMSALTRIVQAKLGGPRDDDEESTVFDKKMDQLNVKSRTMKYLSAKAVQNLSDLRSNFLCLGETSWMKFDETEQQAESMVHNFRQIGILITEELSKLVTENPLTYCYLIDQMTMRGQELRREIPGAADSPLDGDVFTLLTSQMDVLQHNIDELVAKSDDVSSCTEFEINVAPWILRSKELKAQKIIAPEVQDEINQLERRNQELTSRIIERERVIEEMNMRVEVAEKRMKDSRARDDKEKASQEEVENLRKEREENELAIKSLRTELEDQAETARQDRLELEALRKGTSGEVIPAAGVQGLVDDSAIKKAQLEVNLLQAEINALEAAVRFLREENRALRIPVTDTLLTAAKSTWLETPLGGGRHQQQGFARSQFSRKHQLQGEVKDIYADLMNVAASLKPVRLAGSKALGENKAVTLEASSTSQTTWRPTSQKPRYTILKQREEWEKWAAWRSDLVQRAKVIDSTLRRPTGSNPDYFAGSKSAKSSSRSQTLPTEDGSNLITPSSATTSAKIPQQASKNKLTSNGDANATEAIQIVES